MFGGNVSSEDFQTTLDEWAASLVRFDVDHEAQERAGFTHGVHSSVLLPPPGSDDDEEQMFGGGTHTGPNSPAAAAASAGLKHAMHRDLLYFGAIDMALHDMADTNILAAGPIDEEDDNDNDGGEDTRDTQTQQHQQQPLTTTGGVTVTSAPTLQQQQQMMMMMQAPPATVYGPVAGSSSSNGNGGTPALLRAGATYGSGTSTSTGLAAAAMRPTTRTTPNSKTKKADATTTAAAAAAATKHPQHLYHKRKPSARLLFDSESTMRLQKVAQRTLKFAEFIDYRRLKSHLLKAHTLQLQQQITPATTPRGTGGAGAPPAWASSQDVAMTPIAEHSAAGSHAAAQPAPSPPSKATSHHLMRIPSVEVRRGAFLEARDLFWSIFKSEVDKINEAFLLREQSCERILSSLGLDDGQGRPPAHGTKLFSAAAQLQRRRVAQAERQAQLRNVSALGGVHPASNNGGGVAGEGGAQAQRSQAIFARILLEKRPKLAHALLAPDVLEAAHGGVEIQGKDEQRTVLRLTTFFNVCNELDALRRYSMLNYLACLKLLKKYSDYVFAAENNMPKGASAAATDDHALVSAFRNSLSGQHFCASATLAQMLHRAESITNRLITRRSVDEASTRCKLCCQLLHRPVALACCQHRFCFDCLVRESVFNHGSCPVCDRQQQLDPRDLQLDSVLTRFVGLSMTPLSSNMDTVAAAAADAAAHAVSEMATAGAYNVIVTSNNKRVLNTMGQSDPNSHSGEMSRSRYSHSPSVSSNSPNNVQHQTSAQPQAPKDSSKFSCHHCKLHRAAENLAFCTRAITKTRDCRKKYCRTCLDKHYGTDLDDLGESNEVDLWVCPSCHSACSCAHCRRRAKNAEKGSDDSAAIIAANIVLFKQQSNRDQSKNLQKKRGGHLALPAARRRKLSGPVSSAGPFSSSHEQQVQQKHVARAESAPMQGGHQQQQTELRQWQLSQPRQPLSVETGKQDAQPAVAMITAMTPRDAAGLAGTAIIGGGDVPPLLRTSTHDAIEAMNFTMDDAAVNRSVRTSGDMIMNMDVSGGVGDSSTMPVFLRPGSGNGVAAYERGDRGRPIFSYDVDSPTSRMQLGLGGGPISPACMEHGPSQQQQQLHRVASLPQGTDNVISPLNYPRGGGGSSGQGNNPGVMMTSEPAAGSGAFSFTFGRTAATPSGGYGNAGGNPDGGDAGMMSDVFTV